MVEAIAKLSSGGPWGCQAQQLVWFGVGFCCRIRKRVGCVGACFVIGWRQKLFEKVWVQRMVFQVSALSITWYVF